MSQIDYKIQEYAMIQTIVVCNCGREKRDSYLNVVTMVDGQRKSRRTGLNEVLFDLGEPIKIYDHKTSTAACVECIEGKVLAPLPQEMSVKNVRNSNFAPAAKPEKVVVPLAKLFDF